MRQSLNMVVILTAVPPLRGLQIMYDEGLPHARRQQLPTENLSHPDCQCLYRAQKRGLPTQQEVRQTITSLPFPIPSPTFLEREKIVLVTLGTI